MLHPASTNRLEFSLPHLCLDSVIQRRVELLQPFILLGRRTGETVLGITINQIALAGPGAGYLAFGLVPRPEPASVNMAMANGVDDMFFVSIVNFR